MREPFFTDHEETAEARASRHVEAIPFSRCEFCYMKQIGSTVSGRFSAETNYSFPNLGEEADFQIGDSPPFREGHQIFPIPGEEADLKIGVSPPFREDHQIFPSLGEGADLKNRRWPSL